MALKSPTWLDESYVRKILRNAEKDESIEVSHIFMNEAAGKGENYGSDMYRVSVKFSRVRDGHPINETKSLLVKIAPVGGPRAEMIESVGLFEKELPMLSVTLPRMNESLENLCSTLLSARSYYVQYKKPVHIVIEDLAPKGFQMANREVGLDLDHCLLVLRNLGIFHAASVGLKEKSLILTFNHFGNYRVFYGEVVSYVHTELKDPDAFANYTKGMLHKDQLVMRRFFSSGAKVFAKEAAKWPELSPRITEKLVKLSEVLFDKGCEAALYREDDFNVLNHGDLWINNLLFRYDKDRKPIDHIFVDFQISNYGSPVIDVLHFIGSSTTHEVRLQHRELLLHEYYSSLSCTMTKLKCNTKVPSFDKLQESIKERAFCEVIASTTVLPLVLLEKEKAIEREDMGKNDEEYSLQAYRGEFYRKIMTTLLPWFDSIGLLDM